MSTGAMIEVRNLSKSYGGVRVLEIDTLEIPRGQFCGVVGNNGAGKTTLFSLMLDLVLPDRGEVRSGGRSVRGSEHWKASTGAYLDDRFLVEFLSPEEYFQFVAALYDVDPQECGRRLEAMEPLFRGEVVGRGKLIRELSRGNQKKVGVAAALLPRPEVVILDEPFSHLDPTSAFRLIDQLLAWREERRTTLLVSSHSLDYMARLCDRIVVLERGRVVRDLTAGPDTLRSLQTDFR